MDDVGVPDFFEESFRHVGQHEPQALKREVRKSIYRSAEALRHPKARFTGTSKPMPFQSFTPHDMRGGG